ncbi:MAG: hypothetical protein ACW976_02710, partial [Candidatus Ranarchaeia archaeon]
YLITNSKASNPSTRYLAASLATENTHVDIPKYEEHLQRTFDEILPKALIQRRDKHFGIENQTPRTRTLLDYCSNK